MVTPDVRRAAARFLQDNYIVSERRACNTVICHRSTARYESRREDDLELREKLRAVAGEFPRLG